MSAADRFRPTRYGIVSLYQYAEQVFSPEEGRLALRGRNTSGKSKALELLVPFVLDGDITPRKLDSFASPTRAKTMRWNLIECTDDYARDAKRIGYVWAEFIRRDAAGEEHVLTCGVGLEAVRGSDGVKDRWYFVTPQRIGTELDLCRDMRDERQPLAKADMLAAVRAGGGQTFETQGDYKEAIRSTLLPFPSATLYEQHLEVIRQLRKPKLSDKLDLEGLSGLLSRTLPVVDDALMRRLGDSLERLHGMQSEADELAQACELVAELAGGAFRTYARGVVLTRAEALKQAETGFERARHTERSARTALAHSDAACREAEQRLRALTSEHKQRQAERETLLASDEYKGLAALHERRREHGEAAERLEERLAEHAKHRERLERAEHEREQQEAALDRELEAFQQLATELRDAAVRAGLALADVDQAALERIEGALAMRQAELEQARRHHHELGRARDGAEALREPLEQAQAAVEDARAQHEQAETELETARERVEQALDAWAEELVELALSDADVRLLRELLGAGDDAGARTQELARPRLQALLGEQAKLAARRDELDSAVQRIAARLRELRGQGDPAPAPRSPRPADRAGRPGAPLWLVCDFAPELPADQRGPLEAALEEAGLLDAWISLDGRRHDGDTVLVPEPVAGPSLTQLLLPAVGESGIDPELVGAVLASVPLEGALSVQPGSFRLGPLHGRHAKAEPEFIGAAAREARRRAQIATAEAERAELEAELALLAGQADQLAAAQQRLHAEESAVPSAREVQTAQRAVAGCADRLANAERQRTVLLTRRDDADEAVSRARAVVAEHARQAGLPGEAAQLVPIELALAQVTGGLGSTQRALDRCHHARERLAGGAEVVAERADDEQESAHQERAAAEQLSESRGRLEAAERLHGPGAQQVEARMEELRGRLAAIDREREDVDAGHRQAGIDVNNAGRDVDDAVVEVARADRARGSALADVRRLGPHDLFTAGLGDPHAPADERQSPSWTLTTALERMRALPELDERIDLGNRRRRVEEAVSELAKRLVAFDMDAALRTDGEDLLLVQMSWHGAVKTLPQMVREIREDLDRREQIMSEERRKVFGDALLSEIAEHLRARVAEVKASVRKRNETLRRCKTGAGRWVQLRWQRALESEPEREVLALLEGQSVELLDEQQRRALFEFFETRIVLARGDLLDAAGGRSAADYLAQAFDYRTWWSFDLMLHEPNRDPRRLTAAAQARGSGGEQSVLMHMPLFATAASIYDMVPTAPRIIALDEAMDGIDDPTREQMFAVLVELDLDLFITSFDINPCVATVPRIGFYELHRDQAEWGVYGQHFVWDGRQTIEVDD
jgi:uncharacterized protein (TIGR02680 family)